MYHLTNDLYDVEYLCDVCHQRHATLANRDPQLPEFAMQIFSYDSWFDHIMFHLKESYSALISSFAEVSHPAGFFYFPLTPGYETFTPYNLVITVALKEGKVTTKNYPVDFSLCANYYYLRRTLEFTAHQAYFEQYPKREELEHPITYTVSIVAHQEVPSYRAFKETEAITIPADIGHSTFYPLTCEARTALLLAYSKDILKALQVYLGSLQKNPVYADFYSSLQSSQLFYLSCHATYNLTDDLHLEVDQVKNPAHPFKWLLLHDDTEVESLAFDGFLFDALTFADQSSLTKYSYNLLQTLYYLSMLHCLSP